MAGNGDMMLDMINLAAKRRITDRFHLPVFLRAGRFIKCWPIAMYNIMPSVSEPLGFLHWKPCKWERQP
jgi:hypothetical protein